MIFLWQSSNIKLLHFVLEFFFSLSLTYNTAMHEMDISAV